VVWVPRRRFDPSAFIRKTWDVPVRSLPKVIIVPSGDQLGSPSPLVGVLGRLVSPSDVSLAVEVALEHDLGAVGRPVDVPVLAPLFVSCTAPEVVVAHDLVKIPGDAVVEPFPVSRHVDRPAARRAGVAYG